MEGQDFDQIVRRLAVAGNRRDALRRFGIGAAAGLAGLVGLSRNEAAAKRPAKGNGGGNDKKVTICHHSDKGQHTIQVSESALKAHLGKDGHGDTMGPCAESGGCSSNDDCAVCETCDNRVCKPKSCGSGEQCVKDVCCPQNRICGETCLNAGGCCTAGEPGCPDGKRCDNGTCVNNVPDECSTPLDCAVCETCDGGRCKPVSCPRGQSCAGGICCANGRVCGSTCLVAGQCCTEGRPGCPDGKSCQVGTCVRAGGTGSKGRVGDKCKGINECRAGLRCCGGDRRGGGVCTRSQGGFPNGPRCECCGHGMCSPRFIKKLVRS